MQLKKMSAGVLCTVAFGAGVLVAPMLPHWLPAAQAAVAAPAAQAPQVIDLLPMTYETVPPSANPTMHAATFFSTPNGSVGIQVGNARKHIHLNNDEIQYIIEGSGSMWVGNERKDFKPGTLLIFPRGTPHADAILTSSGPVKALTVKLPPAQADDIHFVN